MGRKVAESMGCGEDVGGGHGMASLIETCKLNAIVLKPTCAKL
jgi:hypothetical protein